MLETHLFLILAKTEEEGVRFFTSNERTGKLGLGIVFKKRGDNLFSSLLTYSDAVFLRLFFGRLQHFYQHSLCFREKIES